jgi:glucose/arabinose dehydrogenase
MRRSTLVGLLVAALLAGCVDSAEPPRPSVLPSPVASPTSAPTVSPSAQPSSEAPTGAPPQLSIEPVVDGLRDPVDIAWRPDDPSTLFVVEQVGRIRMVRDGRLVDRPFLDISGLVRAGGEQGLLGLAFLPSGERGRFFVYYTDRDGSQIVASYDTDPDDADLAAPGTAITWLDMADRFGNHNGGALAFGPDRNLYIATGDGGGAGDPLDSGRSLDTLLAKVLRIDVDHDVPGDIDPRYVVPADNPFVDRSGARPEIWLTGLRNPWRIRFDRANGDLWIGDVGQGDREEVDVARAGTGGLDFGWNVMEGSTCYRSVGDDCATPELTLPVAEYDHSIGDVCSVTGGAVYRGEASPALRGWYLFADYCSGTLWAIDATKDRTDEPAVVAETDYLISSIAEDAAGELFATDHAGGQILRIGLAAG